MGRMRKDVAVVRAGMTLFSSRLQETGKEMSWEATKMALDQAGLSLEDVDAVVVGSAPDAFDGIHKKGENLLDGAGGANKPYMRVYTSGGTAVMAPIAGWWHVASGLSVGRQRREDVLGAAAFPKRLRPHLGPDFGSPLETQSRLDLRHGDAALHTQIQRAL